MTPAEIESAVRRAVEKIAPDADVTKLSPDVDMCDSLDLDSLDFIRVLTELERSLQVKLPASAHARMRTLRGCVDTLNAESSAPREGSR
jgi:acyl carrier protein